MAPAFGLRRRLARFRSQSRHNDEETSHETGVTPALSSSPDSSSPSQKNGPDESQACPMNPPANGHEERTLSLPSSSSSSSLAETKVQVRFRDDETLQKFSFLLDRRSWSKMERLLEDSPDLARQTITVVFQGENCSSTPLHAVLEASAPLAVVDAMVTAYPAALGMGDCAGGRLPLHWALRRAASLAVIQYLVSAHPEALLVADHAGSLPLHTACSYASEEVIRAVLGQCPEAASITNGKSHRCALHLLASRCLYDDNNLSLDAFRTVLDAHPAAAALDDRQGRVPLHIACEHAHPRWDVLRLLVEQHPAGLLQKDQWKLTPVQLHRRFVDRPDHDVVVAFLQERTVREKRKRWQQHTSSVVDKIFTILVDKKEVDLGHCYG